jgi:hypothetical protein
VSSGQDKAQGESAQGHADEYSRFVFHWATMS